MLTEYRIPLIHWQTALVLPDVDAVAPQVSAGLFHLISSGVVPMPDATLGFSKGMLVRDPDGHVMRLVE